MHGILEKKYFFPEAKWIVKCVFTKIKVKVIVAAFNILTDGSFDFEYMDQYGLITYKGILIYKFNFFR